MNLNLSKIIATCFALISIAFSADFNATETQRAHYTDTIQYKTEALDLIQQANPAHITVAPRFAMGQIQGPGLFVPKQGVNQPYGGIERFRFGRIYEIPDNFCNENLAYFKSFSLTPAQDAAATADMNTFIEQYKQELADCINNYQTRLDELNAA